MKNILFILVFMTISFFVNCQDTAVCHASLGNYNSSDTILLDDFVKLSELSLSSSEYSIVSYNAEFVAQEGYTVLLKGNSNTITQEIKDLLLSRAVNMKKSPPYFPGHDPNCFRFFFTDIIVKSTENNEVNIGYLMCKLKMN